MNKSKPILRGDDNKLQTGLHRSRDEDPTFEMHHNPETHETLVGGMGERHLDVMMAILKRKFGVQAELAKPRIAHRETLTAKADGREDTRSKTAVGAVRCLLDS